eukprot:328325-Chlamydomonas_euryale.AAC.5
MVWAWLDGAIAATRPMLVSWQAGLGWMGRGMQDRAKWRPFCGDALIEPYVLAASHTLIPNLGPLPAFVGFLTTFARGGCG